MFEDYVHEADLAREFGGCRRTWQRRRQERTGPPFIKVGAKVMYRRAAVLEWLEGLEVTPPASRERGRSAGASR